MACCRCNKDGKCISCSCVKEGTCCVSCCPKRLGKCKNLPNIQQPSETPNPSSQRSPSSTPVATSNPLPSSNLPATSGENTRSTDQDSSSVIQNAKETNIDQNIDHASTSHIIQQPMNFCWGQYSGQEI